MAVDKDDDVVSGKSEAELAKIRGDDIEDVPAETDEEREEREAAEAASKAEEDEKVVKGKKDDEEADDKKKAADADEEVDEEEEEKKEVKKTGTIPKARFDELRTKSKQAIEALTKQVEDLTKKATVDTRVEDTKKTETAIENLEKEFEALMADGNNSAAAAKMREIRILERSLVMAAATFESEKARAVAVEQVRLDMLVQKLEERFPQINPDAEEYDQEVVDEVMELRTAFEKSGKASSEALSKAVKYVFADKVAKEDEKAKEKDDDADEEKDDKNDKKSAKEKEAERKKAAVARNAKDAKKIPAKTAEHGVDSDKKGGGDSKNLDTMSEEEFNALPESTKARMRGDTLEA